MGCVCKNSRQQFDTSTSLRTQKVLKNLQKTQSSIHDLSDSEFLNIGQEITSLGNLRKEVCDALILYGPFKPVESLDNPTNLDNYTYIQLPDNSIYFGEVKGGIRNGVGRQHWVNEGNYLEAIWLNDKAHGPARMVYPNGDIFEGQLIDNKANGFGVFRNKKKEVRGIWVDNRLQGKGVEIRQNGTIYEGNFVNGLIEGKGTFTFADKRKYIGQVHQGQIHGQGLMLWSDCSYYRGEFKNNQLKGYGCYTDVDSQVYHGYFLSIYHPDENKLEIYFSKEQNIQDQDSLTKFKKQYKL